MRGGNVLVSRGGARVRLFGDGVRFPALAHDVVPFALLDDVLDFQNLVPAHNCEQGWIRVQLLVRCLRRLDLVDAIVMAAFTDDIEVLRRSRGR